MDNKILDAKLKMLRLLNVEYAKLDSHTSDDNRDKINMTINTILSCIDVLDEV